jgi:protein-arginine kinase activator protein McsA
MYEALLGCLKVAKAHLYDVLVRHEDHDGKVPKGIAEVDAARMEVERLETVLTQAEGR